MVSRSTLLASAALLLPLTVAAAQQPAAPAPTADTAAQSSAADQSSAEAVQPNGEDEGDEEEIVIVGARDPNAVVGDIPPENQLRPRDIRAYGAATIAELLDAIAPQTESARGRDGGAPVVLLNGRRISSFRELRDLPPEAILRLDILPEEVALKYGYSADQRVVNIVLRPRYHSTSVRTAGELPTEGGRSESEADVTRLSIGDRKRTTVNVHAERSTLLTENERDIAFTPADANAVDPRPFRSLLGSSREARLGGTLNRQLFGNVSSTFDGQIEWSDGRSLLGPSLTQSGEPLRRDTDSLSGHAGMSFDGDKGRWRWSLIGAYDVARAKTETDREDETPTFQVDKARQVTRTGNLSLLAYGPAFSLPAGRANVSLEVSGDTRDLESRARRAGVESETDLGRDRVSGSVNLDLPIAKRNGALSAIGNLSLNANAQAEHLSDFGTLTSVGAGAYWSPVERLNLITSWTREEGAPGLEQLGGPVLTTPNTRVFDFVRGETALVDAVTGGNPDLQADRRNVTKIGGNWRPSSKLNLDIRADFVRSRIDNPISRFPGPTAAIEAAFPERFERDAQGRLVRVDLRPVNFDSAARDELRWGFTFSKPLKSAQPPRSVLDEIRRRIRASPPGSSDGPPPNVMPNEQDGEPLTVRLEGPSGAGAPSGGLRSSGGDMLAGPPGGGGGPRGPGGMGGRGGGGFFGGQRGRLQLSVFHTLRLKDEVRIRPGLPKLDFLDGDAAESGGGTPRHKIEVDAGYYNNGLGARLSGNWQSASKVTGGDSGTLRFSPLAKVNFSLFANLGDRLDLVMKHPWLRDTQLRLGVDNIFDTKQKVRDATGGVPVNFQPDLLDPQGRTIRISLRKLFSPRRAFRREQERPRTPAAN